MSDLSGIATGVALTYFNDKNRQELVAEYESQLEKLRQIIASQNDILSSIESSLKEAQSASDNWVQLFYDKLMHINAIYYKSAITINDMKAQDTCKEMMCANLLAWESRLDKDFKKLETIIDELLREVQQQAKGTS